MRVRVLAAVLYCGVPLLWKRILPSEKSEALGMALPGSSKLATSHAAPALRAMRVAI